MVHPGRSWTAAGPVRARAPTSAFSSADFPQFYPSDINKLRVFVNLIERERELYQEQDMQWGGSALRDARVRVREHKLLTEWPNRAISGKPAGEKIRNDNQNWLSIGFNSTKSSVPSRT